MPKPEVPFSDRMDSDKDNTCLNPERPATSFVVSFSLDGSLVMAQVKQQGRTCKGIAVRVVSDREIIHYCKVGSVVDRMKAQV